MNDHLDHLGQALWLAKMDLRFGSHRIGPLWLHRQPHEFKLVFSSLGNGFGMVSLYVYLVNLS